MNNARTTFQRVSDAKFFSGWVKAITPDSITILVHSVSIITPGDEFAFQVYGNGHDAFFRATTCIVKGTELSPLFAAKRTSATPLEVSCLINGKMTFEEARGRPRFFVTGITAEVNPDGAEECPRDVVVDIGPVGLSVVTNNRLRKNDVANLRIYVKDLTIECSAEVRNCIQYTVDGEYHRIGFQIKGMARIDARRWRDLYAEILDASKMPWNVSTMDNHLNRRMKRSA
ncbi:MAG TPA: PilZ domain-containing protein [Fimbriimonadaceae bacterium]|nr:PilZ domain-containing protein [Fimbriimonadaceae bacterium]